ncbi:amiloride-sensitive sodium channel subunit gamma-like, partial [Limulus polyphemus]|uniref:Amiloride-sensitive sodium channel subunit gamma-like n=1 Tax=Limulus polyphemus TaxID=6850 RepID=A0ABM1TSS9_LIMPO
IKKKGLEQLCLSNIDGEDKALSKICDTLVDNFDLDNLYYTKSDLQGLLSPRSLFATCPLNNDYNTTVQNKEDIVNMADAYLSLTEKQRMEISTHVYDILAKCSYESIYCSHKNFTTFWSFLYGNCFTFNTKRGNKSHDMIIRTTGTFSGINLWFGIQVFETNELAENGLKLKLIIHSPYIMPDMENDGIDIKPESSLSIGIDQIDYHRLQEPYSEGCYRDDKNVPGSYSRQQCFQKCAQLLSNETCGCGDPTINLPDGVPPCSIKDAADVCCLDEVKENLVLWCEDLTIVPFLVLITPTR